MGEILFVWEMVDWMRCLATGLVMSSLHISEEVWLVRALYPFLTTALPMDCNQPKTSSDCLHDRKKGAKVCLGSMWGFCMKAQKKDRQITNWYFQTNWFAVIVCYTNKGLFNIFQFVTMSEYSLWHDFASASCDELPDQSQKCLHPVFKDWIRLWWKA